MKFRDVKSSLTRQEAEPTASRKRKREEATESDSETEGTDDQSEGKSDGEKSDDSDSDSDSDDDDCDYNGAGLLPGEFAAASFANLKTPAAALRDMLSSVPCIPTVATRLPKGMPQTIKPSTQPVVSDSDWKM